MSREVGYYWVRSRLDRDPFIIEYVANNEWVMFGSDYTLFGEAPYEILYKIEYGDTKSEL